MSNQPHLLRLRGLVCTGAGGTDLNGKPPIVLTADTGNAAGWQQAQDRMATLSTNSSHRLATATTHESLLDDEADSAAASQAIHDVVASVRTSQPLPRR